MAGMFGYSREAVRVKVKKREGVLQPENRKFSVDPQITSFEVLQSILAKAFDIKGEFTVSYRTFDDYGHETYLSLLSDWDLDAAFLSASEPNLCLEVDLKPFEESSDDWDIVGCDVPRAQIPEAKPQNRLPGLIMNQMERTLNLVQRALNLVEDQIPVSSQPPRPPLADAEFRKFLDPIGQVVQYRELRKVIYFGGIEPSLRKVVWKHLLNVYPDGMSGKERMDYMKKKAYEYQALRDCWKDILQNGQVTGDLAFVTSMVRKDVLRTDRHHRFYAGSDDNQNIASLFNILTTYALNHPTVSYCQGMSDLASPLLVTMGDEAHAYICFCALMLRLHSNFLMDGITMTLKFQHLAEGLFYYDPEFYAYLKSHQADDLLFCYRWLLLEMKREFAFEDALCMLEVLWSALPQQTSCQELPLFELQFCPQAEAEDSLAPVSPLVKTPRENAYTKVCALRRQGSAASLQSVAGGATTHRQSTVFTHRQNQSLDETAIRRPKHGVLKSQCKVKPFTSLDDTSINVLSRRNESRSRSTSPFEVVGAPEIEEATNINNHINKKTSSNHSSGSSENIVLGSNNSKVTKGSFSSLDKMNCQDIHKDDAVAISEKRQGRVVKNLNEFLSFKTNNKNCYNEENNSNVSPEKVLDQQSSSNTLHDREITYPPTVTKTEMSDESQLQKRGLDGFSEIKRTPDDSPDDSNEYFPMTTSMTRELRLELENLDRQVFGAKFNQRSLALDDSEELESPVSESCRSGDVTIDAGSKLLTCDCVLSKQESELPSEATTTGVAELCSEPNNKPLVLKLDRSWHRLGNTTKKTDLAIPRPNQLPRRASPGNGLGGGEDIFVWENPLQYPTTPDEQADLEFDSSGAGLENDNCFNASNSAGEIFENEGGVKSVTPIRLVRSIAGSTHRRHRSSPVETSQASDSSDSTPNSRPTAEKLVPAPRRKGSREPSPGSSTAKGCEEAKEKLALRNAQPLNSRATSLTSLPPPHEFGAGNPFLMFLCLTVLRQHRDFVMRNNMDYNEMAMHFDKMVRKHNVTRVLNQARQMYDSYKKQHEGNAGLSV